jgi:hypothetical protein
MNRSPSAHAATNGATAAADPDPIGTTDDARAAIRSRPFPTCSSSLLVPLFCLDGNIGRRSVEKNADFVKRWLQLSTSVSIEVQARSIALS